MGGLVWPNADITSLSLSTIPDHMTATLSLRLLSRALLLAFMTGTACAAELTIRTDLPGVAVAPTLYGVFFEDINRAGDGGLYAEMIQNRSFEDHPTPLGWRTLDNPSARFSVDLDVAHPLNANNRTSLKLTIASIGKGRVGVFNQGFKGVPAGKSLDTSAEWLNRFAKAQDATVNGLAVQAGATYLLDLHVRAEHFAGTLTATLESRSGRVLARQTIKGLGEAWSRHSLALIPTATDSDARLVLSADRPGTLWFDMVSLFPEQTWKGRRQGLRADMMNLLVAMKPGLLRFPGGSFSEGAVLKDAWKWKETLGDISERPGNWNIWGYRSTNGLGFHEYLQMAEDLGAEPLFVAHVGMAEKDFVPEDELEPWIQDVLDAIEYANGPVTSTWGAKRAAAGHPASFNLRYVEIGNENGMGYPWGGGTRADYLPRYRAFFDRIKKQYPDIVTLSNIHTEPDAPAEIVDEHYYETPEWFFKAATLYDDYDRIKPKIYVGEYAAQKGNVGHGNLLAALSEAAFLTGLERNADMVRMSSYAPLFTNPQWERWKPDAIVFDSTRVYATPSYHVQAMFAGNRPDSVWPVDRDDAPELFASAGSTRSGELIIKLVNRSERAQDVTLKLAGAPAAYAQGSATTLTGPQMEAENSFEHPSALAPAASAVPALRSGNVYTCPPRSLTVLRWTMMKL